MNKNITILLSPYKGISWKKILRNWLIIFIILGALTVYGAYALNSKDLIAYYDMESDPSSGLLSDVTGHGYTITLQGGSSCYMHNNSVNALLGYSMQSYTGLLNCMANNSNFMNLQGKDWSINFWTHGTVNTASSYVFRMGNGTNTTGNHFQIRPSGASVPIRMDYGIATGFQANSTFAYFYPAFPAGTWTMITLVYNYGKNISMYYNGVLINSTTYTDVQDVLGNNWTKTPTTFLQILRTPYETYDEFSIWNASLSEDYIINLYGSGQGLNFNQTIFLENSTSELNTCNGQTLCNTGFFTNTTSFVCTSLSFCGPPLYCQGPTPLYGVFDGGATCGTPLVTNVYDICMRNQNIICKNMTLNSLIYFGQNYTIWDRATEDCPTFIDGNFNKVACGIQCIDNYTYYHDTLKGDPVGMNFTAYCGNGTNQCPNPGVFRCYSDQVVEQCQVGNDSYYYWNHYGDCAQNYVCRQGQCLYNGALNSTATPDVPLGTQTQGNNDLWNGFFGIDTSTSTGKLLCALVAIAIFTLALTGVMIGISSASGVQTPMILNVGIVGSGFIMSTLYFIAIGFIPFWILLITICIIGLGLGSWFVKKPMPGG